MTTWKCDGIPKDGKDYSQAIAGGHQPCENTGPDCLICGLPQEAMDLATGKTKTVIVAPGGSLTAKKSTWLLPVVIAATALAAGLGGWGLMQLLVPKSDIPPVKPSETTTNNPNQGEFVSKKAKNSQLFSQGEKILLNSTPEKEQGAAAFAGEDWPGAIAAYEKAATPQANDPEGKIYYNNAKARKAGSPHTIAVVVPIKNDSNSAKEVLRGVARYQEEFNRSASGKLLEVVIANDGGGLQSTAIADDLIGAGQVLGIMGHGIDPFSQQAIGRYEAAGLAILSPLTTSVSTVRGATLKTVSVSDKSNEVLGNYLDAVGKTLAKYASKKEANPAVVIFYNSDNSYSKQLKDSFSQALTGVKGKLVQTVDTNESNFDAKTAIQTAKQGGAKVVFLALSKDGNRIDQAVTIAKEASSMLLLGGNELYTPNILIQGGKAINGLILAVPWSFQPTDPFAKDAVKSWRGRVSWRTATAYDAMKVLGDTIAKNPDRASVTGTLNQGVALTGSNTNFNLFNDVPLVRANRGSDGPTGSQYQFDPI